MDGMNNPDEAADLEVIQQALEPIVTVIKQMLDKMAALDEEVDALSKLVNEEIIGGITNLYNAKERTSGIAGLSEKYGEKMGPYKDFYSEMTEGDDIYEKLYDELQEMKGEAGELDDAAIEAKVQGLSDALKAKFDKIKGLGQPEAVVEVAVEEPAKDEESALVDKIRGMKQRFNKAKE